MKEPDEVLTMKTLHAKGRSATKIADMLGCSHHTVLRYVRNGFDTSPRKLPPSVLDAHTEFLLERFLRHNGNADVVRQELAAEVGIQVSLRTVQCALKPFRERLRASRLATQRFETKPGEQLQIDFGVKTVSIEGRNPSRASVCGDLRLFETHVREGLCTGDAGGMVGRHGSDLRVFRRRTDHGPGRRKASVGQCQGASSHAPTGYPVGRVQRAGASLRTLLGFYATGMSTLSRPYEREGGTQRGLCQGERTDGSVFRQLGCAGSPSTAYG